MSKSSRTRRPAGEGTFFKRNDGRGYTVKSSRDGKIIETTCKTAAATRDKHACKLAAMEALQVAPSRLTVGEWAEQMLREREMRMPSSPSNRHYRSTIANHVLPYKIARMPLHAVGPADCIAHEAEMRTKGASDHQCDKARERLSTYFNVAIDRDLIAKKPYRGVASIDVETTHVPPLTDEQFAAWSHAFVGHRYEVLYVIATTIGLREAECFGLQVGDFNEKANTLAVVRQYQGRSAGLGRLKNREKSGPIALPYNVGALVAAHVAERRAAGAKPTDFLFLSPEGCGLNDSHFREEFDRFVATLDCARFTFQGLRATACVRAMEAGLDIHAVAHMLGHKNIATTAAHYARYTARLTAHNASRVAAKSADLPSLKPFTKVVLETVISESSGANPYDTSVLARR